MKRVLSLTFGILILALAATGLTEASLVFGQRQVTSPEPIHHTTVAKVTKPAATVSTTTSTTKATTPTGYTAVTNGFVHLRAQPSTTAAIVTDLQAGTTVSYTSADTGLWQAVSYGSYSGYVYKTYLNY